MQAGPDILTMAMAARPGALDKAYIVGSSFSIILNFFLTSVRCHGCNVSYLLLKLKGTIGLDEYARSRDIWA